MQRALPAALLLFGLACASLPPRAPREPFDVQGHRGARGLLPENTLPAFRRALELGVTTLELDVGLSADGALVVVHDRRLSGKICRGPGGEPLPEAGPRVRDLTLEEIKRFDCGALNPDRGRFPEPPRRNLPGTPIPTLDEVFDLAAELDPAARFNVEIKHDPTAPGDTAPLEEMVAAVVGRIRERGLVERTTVQSFDWRALELAKGLEPGLATAALLSPRTARGPGGGASPWLNGLSLAGAGGTSAGLLAGARDWVDVFSPHWRLVLPGAHGYLGSTVEELQAAGFRVVPWTVNSPARMEKILDLGVDGLITDYPDRLLAVLAARGVEVR